ncbi:hypothetical protein EDD22DRAFT_847996 [Suillus occidentalis]|nr:hypothetical protein EDD22DRAFT_847996 [Suillus occidentalis]
MSTDSNPVIALANATFHHVGDKVEHMVGQALQLEAADPKHINIVVEMAHALSHVFSVYALQTTAVPPMVLSAAAELQEHLDSSFCKVVSTPVWTNIRPNDPCNKISPLYPKSVGYDQPPPPSPAAATITPAAGPSTKAKGKQRAVPEEDSEDERGHQRGRAKRPRAMSVVAAPKSKRQRAKSKSKAIITSDDDMELDNAVPVAAPQRVPAPAKPLKGVFKSMPLFVPNPVFRPGPHYVEIDELEEDTIVGPAPKMGPPYVDIPYSPPQRLPAEQEANAKLLAGQVAALQQEANSAAESTAADALPVVRTDATQTPTAAAAQPEEETPAATQEEQEQLPCVATAPEQAAAQQDEIPAVTAMQVDESPVNGEESNEAAPQEIGAAVEQESASITSTAHD